MLASPFEQSIANLSQLYTIYVGEFTSTPRYAEDLYDALVFAHQLFRTPDDVFADDASSISADEKRLTLLVAKLFSIYQHVFQDKQSPMFLILTRLFREIRHDCPLLRIADVDHRATVADELDGDEAVEAEMARYQQFRDYLDACCPGVIKLILEDDSFESTFPYLPYEDGGIIKAYARLAYSLYLRQINPSLTHHIDDNTHHVTQEALTRAGTVFKQHIEGLLKGGFYRQDIQGKDIPRHDFPAMLQVLMYKTNHNLAGGLIPELRHDYPLREALGREINTPNIWKKMNTLMNQLFASLTAPLQLAEVTQALSRAFDDHFDFEQFKPTLPEPALKPKQ